MSAVPPALAGGLAALAALLVALRLPRWHGLRTLGQCRLAAFGLLLVSQGPMLVRPRVDGEPG
ncbi:hypothetical protein [Falsiroseomonas oryzae]|uniref:hypothetical protein n=1 Tax=Falsiroseomonas oryzae TaxID=2766473 RepID=UPI0022EB0474|nr:hypothetical protein [Roseomonas sp. MO-31]